MIHVNARARNIDLLPRYLYANIRSVVEMFSTNKPDARTAFTTPKSRCILTPYGHQPNGPITKNFTLIFAVLTPQCLPVTISKKSLIRFWLFMSIQTADGYRQNDTWFPDGRRVTQFFLRCGHLTNKQIYRFQYCVKLGGPTNRGSGKKLLILLWLLVVNAEFRKIKKCGTKRLLLNHVLKGKYF